MSGCLPPAKPRAGLAGGDQSEVHVGLHLAPSASPPPRARGAGQGGAGQGGERARGDAPSLPRLPHVADPCSLPPRLPFLYLRVNFLSESDFSSFLYRYNR